MLASESHVDCVRRRHVLYYSCAISGVLPTLMHFSLALRAGTMSIPVVSHRRPHLGDRSGLLPQISKGTFTQRHRSVPILSISGALKRIAHGCCAWRHGGETALCDKTLVAALSHTTYTSVENQCVPERHRWCYARVSYG